MAIGPMERVPRLASMPGADDSEHDVAVAITIVTYDSPPELLEQCVERVLSSTDPDEVLVVVADTGGAAGRRLSQSGHIDRVEVIDLGSNGGFAAGVDAGFRVGLQRGAEVLVSLNDDVLVEPGWLDPLVAALADDESGRVGAVQPLLVQLGTDPPTVNSAGVEIDRHGAGSDRLRDEPLEHAEPAELEAVTGGAAAWSAAFVREVGPIDRRFFLYYEDVEWCRRGAGLGWSFRLVPASRVLHAGSASTHRLGDSLRRIQERNRLWTVAMHGSAREMFAAWSLSLRRLRHEPRSVHRAALIDGTRGAGRRLVDRLRRRSTTSIEAAPTAVPPAFLRRPVTGVNVLGYHHISSGLGESARTIAACLRAAGVDVVEVDNDHSNSPRRRPARPEPVDRHPITIAVVTAFEWEGLVARTPWLREPGHRLIAYWMWELEEVPASHVAAMRVLDEVWLASSFCRGAYAAVAPGHVPVRKAPYQIEWAAPSGGVVDGWRRRWGDRFTFAVTFDYLSIPERKNPMAAVRAFIELADELGADHEMLLVIKSMNGDQRPDAMAEVLAVVDGRTDIVVVDEHLTDEEHHGLIAAADCLVSPHRSEGFGIQPFIALGLGTPVIATRYGGVLDFLDDSNSLLVDAGRIGVVDGEGIYPVGAEWADIDHRGLVDAMRRVVTDPARRTSLIEAGLATAAAWPDDAELGAMYRALLERAEPRTVEADDIA